MGTGEEKQGVKRVVKVAKLLVRGAEIILPFTFAYLTLSTIPAVPIVDAASGLFLKLALVLYYFAWIAGLRVDMGAQERVLSGEVDEKKTLLRLFGVAVVLAGLFVLLLRAATLDSVRLFTFTLAAFWVADLVSWKFVLGRIVVPLFDRAREGHLAPAAASSDRDGLYRLEIVRTHILGHWRTVRFAAGTALLAAVIVLAWSPTLVSKLAGKFGLRDQAVAPLACFLFVAAVELWIWYYRLRLHYSKALLRELREIDARRSQQTAATT